MSLTAIAAAPAAAHGDIHPRIEALSAALREKPGDVHLLDQRAQLLLLDEDWAAAESDLSEALTRAPNDATRERRLANAWLHLGAPAAARDLLDGTLRNSPGDADAHLLRARANRDLGDLDLALGDYGLCLALTPAPSPETFVERADAIMRLEPIRDSEALRGLEEGVMRLGPLVSLIERAVDLARDEASAKRASELAHQLPEPLLATYRWQAKLGQLYLLMGKQGEAKDAYQAALMGIESLPVVKQQTEATTLQRSEIEQALLALKSSEQRAAPTEPFPDAGCGERATPSPGGLFLLMLGSTALIAFWAKNRQRS